MSSSPFFLYPPLPKSCRYHSTLDARCMGCRMAMGAPAESYYDYRDQKCYNAPVSPPPPLSPTSSVVSGESDEESYLLRMRFALQEMDQQVEFVAGERFLDLGCCPGGFSTYVLTKLPMVQGEGVSLPVELGGHSLAIPSDLRTRFQVHWGDMTRFNQALEHAGSGRFSELPRFPIPSDSFDLVLADGHIPPELSRAPGISPYARDLLLVSQLLAGIRAVKRGGTILVKLSLSFANRTLDSLMHRLVLALDNMSTTRLRALKPKSIYAKEGSFYVLVQGVKPVPRRMLELALETMWVQLTEGRKVDNRALDRLVSSAETRQRQNWLKAFLEPVEEIRRAAKQRMT